MYIVKIHFFVYLYLIKICFLDSEKNSEKRKVSINRRNLFKNEFINFPLFLESLAFSAMFFRFEGEFSDVDKLLYMIERMNHSNGVNKSQMKSGKT